MQTETPSLTAHLTPVMSERGFQTLPAIGDLDGKQVRLYESSLATQPAVRLSVGNSYEQHAHLSLDALARLGEQIAWMLANHYQAETDAA